MGGKPLPQERRVKEIAWVVVAAGSTSMLVTFEDGTRETFAGVEMAGVSVAGSDLGVTAMTLTWPDGEGPFAVARDSG